MKGRFAPSPSGEMHLGNAFAALLSWLSVRSRGGSLVLRMEDLDPQRCSRARADGVEADLLWLGLDWDEGGSRGGDRYYQSHRTELYCAALEELRRKDLLYPCFCTRGQLHASNAPHNADGEVIYSGTCRNLTAEEREEWAKLRRPALRIRVPEKEIVFRDEMQGLYRSCLDRDCGDFLLRRSDGVFAYQLAVVVDDAEMDVTEVVRGRDLLFSTPRQIWLQQLLGLPTPAYAHVPLLLAPDGRRLSKRDADLSLAALRAKGVQPEEIVGQLACAAGLIDRYEPMTAAELADDFDWCQIRREDFIFRWIP